MKMISRYIALRVLVLAALLCPLWTSAQVATLDSLFVQAREYSAQKQYAESNKCYELLIDLIRPGDHDGSYTKMMRGFIAMNYLNMGVPLFKEGKYDEAKPCLERAVEYGAGDPKISARANAWLGDWYSRKVLTLQAEGADLQQALDYCLSAEGYYRQSDVPVRLLKQQLSRANILHDLNRDNEAMKLLQQLLAQSEGEFEAVHAGALYWLGRIEQEHENFREAIGLLEQSYNEFLPANRAEAMLAARAMLRIYTHDIPDDDKAAMWQQRVDELGN